MLRGKLLATARTDARSPLHALDSKAAVLSDGRIAAGDASGSVSEMVARNHPDGLEAAGESTPMWADPNFGSHSIDTYGAHLPRWVWTPIQGRSGSGR